MRSRTSTKFPSERSESARARLLEAAVEVFGRKGPDGATVRDIAEASGQNIAAISYYFGNKEQLYRAVIEGVAQRIRGTLADVLSKIDDLRERDGAPEEAMRRLEEFLEAVYLRFLCRQEATPIARLIVREQMQPTAAFEILYEQAFRHLHETLCFLVGKILGQNPKSAETIVRTHTLMGQVYFFAMSRETILRRLGWKDLEGRNAELVTRIIAENIETLLNGLSERKGQKAGPNA